jgi:hypothetical protein
MFYQNPQNHKPPKTKNENFEKRLSKKQCTPKILKTIE